MLERILDYERNLFFLLNGSDYATLDRFMWLYSGKIVWLPLAAFITFALIYRKDWRESILILLSITVVVALCDQFASHIFKPMFTRFRPTHHPDFMNEVDTVFGYRGGRYGFISSHAANAFGFAMYMALLFRDRFFTWVIFIWAIVTAYTRIYLGVHFISDIVPGALLGTFFGYIVYKLYVYTRKKVLNEKADLQPPSAIHSHRCKRLITYAILITVLLITLFNIQLVSWLL